MAEAMQTRRPLESDTPRSISPGTRYSPIKDASREANGHSGSPLRSEFKIKDGRERDTQNIRLVEEDEAERNGLDEFSDSLSSTFRLQQPPQGKRMSSGYFAPAHESTSPIREREASDPPGEPLTWRRTGASGEHTPVHRRSVQFARPSDHDGSADPNLTRPNLSDPDATEDSRGRQGSFLARLKAFAAPSSQGHTRHASSTGSVAATPYMTPRSELEEPRYPNTQQDGSEAEGDVEEDSEGETPVPSAVRPKRREKRRMDIGHATAPTTPRTPRFSSFMRDRSSGTPGVESEGRPGLFSRRSTLNETDGSRAGVSEDEGRDRLSKAWRRGLEGARGLSYHQHRRTNDSETPDGRRPTALRRFTGMANLDGTSSSPFRTRNDRHNSASVHKWRQVKAGLKMIGQRKRDERVKVDYQKSAELMAELLAGSPAALFLASMYQRDEHGHRKIPVLLEQLKITIPISQTREDKSGDRHLIFNICIEYGNGPSRMKWSIQRSIRDFVNLHLKYKLQSQTERYIQLKGEDRRRAKIPRFPKSAFPYARGIRGLGDEDDEDDEDIPGEGVIHDAEASGTDRSASKKGKRHRFGRRKSSFAGRPDDGITGQLVNAGNMAGAAAMHGGPKTLYPDRQRKKLEVYLQQMIRWLIFRPESTRLCKFLELSALAMRLSVEGGYHGKEGLLTITSSRNVDRGGLVALRALPGRLKTMPERHKPKWFLVRHSYLVAVDTPESLLPTEVFLVDPDFTTDKRKKRLRDQSGQEIAKTAAATAQPKHHLLKLYNSERKLRLLARNERQLAQFKESVEQMMKQTVWAQKQRFDSFAPVRKGVFARWLVDGRDHMWQVSRAIDNARNFVYIHDWWLSPELYLRRPAAISQKWRLDRLLLRKAQEGVKIFVIVYRNIESAIPIDSEYTKASLLDLHPNVCVQRSPNQFRQNQFFWAHHEKLVVVDNAMAFVGGVDLCFGRWDDPTHTLVDDKLTGFELDMDVPRNADNCQMWPGKDYSNPRVQDFYALDRPYEEMYDRTKVPRMPWHDIAMTLVGQPARDIGRHFVQRWNYILRQRTPSRPTPILLPPPEFEQDELERLGMDGTCQVQILRSCSSWSIGTPNKTECSIMNAYVALIEQSQHFVYIENQFFISSCTVEGTTIHNKIGDALVERIELAAERGDNWRACIIIPLMPGFQNSVDSQDGTSIRLIMQCQYRSICRGETSIFGRLRAKGIDPTQYIEFYALRQWGKIGPRKSLTTEQLYIHAKCMIVDDRTCIIGSANINERSMLGSRDSEVAAVVTDQDLLPSFMGGEPFDVGVFPHTLRMRLMREHLGIDVDEVYRHDGDRSDQGSIDAEMEHIYREAEQPATEALARLATGLTESNLAAEQSVQASSTKPDSLGAWINSTGGEDLSQVGSNDKAKKSASEAHELDVAGYGPDNMKKLDEAGVIGGTATIVNSKAREVLASPVGSPRLRRASSTLEASRDSPRLGMVENPTMSTVPPSVLPRMTTTELGLTQLSQLPALPILDDTDIGGPPLTRSFSKSSASIITPLLAALRRPIIGEDCMQDPLIDSFYTGIWHKVAENNTKLYRQVFRCMPDSEVLSWTDYNRFNAYNERFMQAQGLGNSSKPKPAKEAPDTSGPPGLSAGAEALLSVRTMTEKTASSAVRGNTRLGEFAEKMLSKSKTKDSTTNEVNAELDEKQRLEAGSRASDAITAPGEGDQLDEKAAQRTADTAASTPNPNMTPDLSKSTTATGRPRGRTLQFAAGTNDPTQAPPDAATTTPNPQSSSTTPVIDQDSNAQKQQQRRRRGTTKSSGRPFLATEEVLSKDEAEELLKLIQGHLVLWPYDWLEREEKGGNWLYNIDQIAPLEIYD